MKCPKCNGKVRAVDSVHVEPRNEIYRKRKCTVCGHIFYTIEFEVDHDNALKRDWAKYYRKN
jgi:transcriptional regulator NrdR family protein